MNYLNIVLWSLGIGACLCNFYIYYNRVILGGFIRELLKLNAFSAETAADPTKNGMKNVFLQNALKSKSNTLYGVITQCDNGYYIPDLKKQKAEKMFSKKGSSILVVLLSSVAILAVTRLAIFIVPYIIEAAKNVF